MTGAGQELLDLVEPRVGITRVEQVVVPGELDQPGAGDVLGEEAAVPDADPPVPAPMQDQRGHLNRTEDVAGIELPCRLEQPEHRGRRVRQPFGAGPPAPPTGIDRQAGGHCCESGPVAPAIPQQRLPELVLLDGQPARVVRSPRHSGEAAIEHQRRRALGIGPRVQDAHRSAVALGDQRSPIAAGGVHDRLQVGDAVLQRQRVVGRQRVGHTGAAVIEQDEPRKRTEPLKGPRDQRLFPHDVEDHAFVRDEDDVQRPVPDHLKGDAGPPTGRIAGLRDGSHGRLPLDQHGRTSTLGAVSGREAPVKRHDPGTDRGI